MSEAQRLGDKNISLLLNRKESNIARINTAIKLLINA
jgi:hypothetical protein